MMMDGTTKNTGFDPGDGEKENESWQLTAPCCRVTPICASALNPLRTEMTRDNKQQVAQQVAQPVAQLVARSKQASCSSGDGNLQTCVRGYAMRAM